MDESLNKAISGFFKTCDELVEETNKMIDFYKLSPLSEEEKVKKIQELKEENEKLKTTFLENVTALNSTVLELRNRIKDLEKDLTSLVNKISGSN